MHHGVRQSIDPVAQYNATNDQAFEPAPYAPQHHRGLDPDATEEEIIDFWQSSNPINANEISIIQDAINDIGANTEDGRRFARFLDYRATGKTNGLEPQDFEFFDIEPPDPYAATYEEIDMAILTADQPERDPEMANWIASIDIGDAPSDLVVQHLTAQVYSGRMSIQQAYAKAFQSGLPKHDIYVSFSKMMDVLND